MVLTATLVFIFGPNLKTKTLLRPRPKLNNNLEQKGQYSCANLRAGFMMAAKFKTKYGSE